MASLDPIRDADLIGEFVLVNARTGEPLVRHVSLARSSWRRLLALLGRRWLDPDEATRFFWAADASHPVPRLPVDILLLDRDGLVLHALHSLSPFLDRSRSGVHSVVELPAGTLARLDTRTGDTIEMRRAHGPRRESQP